MQQAASDGMERAKHHSRLSGLQHVAQLLSGHQTAAATILAASMGDVRLATLVSQVRNTLRPSTGVLSQAAFGPSVCSCQQFVGYLMTIEAWPSVNGQWKSCVHVGHTICRHFFLGTVTRGTSKFLDVACLK